MIQFLIPLKTVNPLNGAQGRSRGAVFAKAARRKKERQDTLYAWLAINPSRANYLESTSLPCVVKLTRIAPRPLDSHDGLRAALKSVVDQLAVCIGCPVNVKGHARDDDPRVRWEYDQRRGGVRVYGVEVTIS